MRRAPHSTRFIAVVISGTAAWSGLAALVCVLLAAPRAAHACSQPTCWSAALVPGPGLERTVPANLPALYWRPLFGAGAPQPDPAAVTLAPIDQPDAPVALTASETPDGHMLLGPAASLVPGTTYRLADSSVCEGTDDSGPQILFEAGEEAPLPASLGQLVATDIGVGPVEVETASGSCAASIEADRVELALVPASDAEPWMELLHFETMVDGSAWRPSSDITVLSPPGASWAGRGRDLVHAACEPDPAGHTNPGAAEGSHEVAMRATLPGTDLSLETGPVTVDLRCGTAGDDDGDTDEPGSDPGGEDDEDGGCSTGGGRCHAAGLLALFGAGLMVGRRRRRLIARERTCDADQA